MDPLVLIAGYAVTFLVAQRAGFVLHWRGLATKISMEEFALVAGVLLLPPVTLFVVIVASVAANQALSRRPLRKAAFNVAQYTIAAGASVGAFAGAVVVGVVPLLAVVPVPFVFSLTSQGAMAILFARIEGERPWRVFRERFLVWSLIGATIGLCLGLGAFALWQLHPLAVLAVLPIFLLLQRFGRLTEWAEEEVRVHKALAQATTRVATTGEFDDIARSLIETSASVFGAGEVRLRLALRPGEPREWSWRHDRGAASHGMRATIGPASAPHGEIEVFPRVGQRQFVAHDRDLLTVIAASAASAATGHRAMLELREANQRLVNVNRELGEFTLWTTHDMREPLRSVAQLAGILHEDLAVLDAASVLDLTSRIQRGADGLKDRIKALHEFSRVVQEDGAFETVLVDEVLDEVEEGLAACLAEKGARLVRVGPLHEVRGQRARLAKVFANIIENAVKHSDQPAPVIEVGAQRQGGQWEFSIRDDGPGIDPAFRERAFQLFQRGPGAKQGGSGAGLAIVKRIVEQHGGRAWITGAPHRGADVRFTLPAAPPVPRDPAAPAAGTFDERIISLV